MANSKLKPPRASQRRWRLTDAKARFSELVKLAHKRPQRVTVDGVDSVVIVDATTYDREHAHRTGAELIGAFNHPAIADLEFDRETIAGGHRTVEL